MTARTHVYACDDHEPFTVRVVGESAWLFLPSGTLDLPRIVDAGGEAFGDGVSSYRRRVEEAQFVLRGQVYRNCSDDRSRAVWEDAKLRGAGFRAVGNEPGWTLEMFSGDRVVFENNYGRDRHLFGVSDPEVDQAGRVTRYRLNNRDHRLMVILEGKACTDSMSGETFATRVTLIFDGRPYGGCGRALH